MKFKTLLKFSTFVLLSFACWRVGYQLGNKKSSTLEIPQNQAFAPKNSAQRATRTVTSQQAPSNPAFKSRVTFSHLEKRQQDFTVLFSPTPLGKSMSEISTLLKMLPMTQTPEGAWLVQQLASLRSQPNETFNELQRSVRKIPSEYSLERQFWVQFVLQLEVPAGDKQQFFTEELQRSIAPYNAKDPTTFNGATALSALMQQTSNPNDIEPALRQSLSQAPDDAARSLLLNTYSSKFPAQAQALKSQMSH